MVPGGHADSSPGATAGELDRMNVGFPVRTAAMETAEPAMIAVENRRALATSVDLQAHRHEEGARWISALLTSQATSPPHGPEIRTRGTGSLLSFRLVATGRR